MRYVIIAVAMLGAFSGTAHAAAVGVGKPHRLHPHRVTIGDHVARLALDYRGRPYVYGGSGPDGFDCSGFTRYVYARVGIALPHSSYAQWGSGRHVSRTQLRPGDLVFFAGLSHVGLYLGHGRFIHAPHTGLDVSVASLHFGWYASTYSGAVRVAGAGHPYGRRGADHRGGRTARSRHGALFHAERR
ncbi:MAG TPA: C40 family peptidase [Bryobacteraceae bacterium]|jgi:cell wall-associated NlpC family hydrolase|nr:C40 family peptidase [Gaiellales bacterium]